jgi:hypothetical protein
MAGIWEVVSVGRYGLPQPGQNRAKGMEIDAPHAQHVLIIFTPWAMQ